MLLSKALCLSRTRTFNVLVCFIMLYKLPVLIYAAKTLAAICSAKWAAKVFLCWLLFQAGWA